MEKPNILKSSTYFIKNSIIISISLFLVCACSVKQRKGVSSNNANDDRGVVAKSDSNLIVPSNSKIIFLNYKVTKNLNGQVEISLINKILKSGNLKNKLGKNDNYVSGDFKFNELNGNSMPIYSFYVPNPLRKSVEYVNNYGEFERKIIELDSTELSARIQLNPKTKFIAIDQVNDLGESKRNLIITKIN